jgi:hypothetical protein
MKPKVTYAADHKTHHNLLCSITWQASAHVHLISPITYFRPISLLNQLLFTGDKYELAN